MRIQTTAFVAVLLMTSMMTAKAQTPPPADTSPHKILFVTVDKDVRLEVLDWGGTGRPLVFLAGLTSTAHQFDTLALKFTASNHVYAITRRGFGASSKPDPVTGDYSADRLGDDVLAVIDALKLDHPVLAGHSVAGEELSSVGSRHPETVSGLIYLDAGYAYAYYTPGNTEPLGVNLIIDAKDLSKKLEQLKPLPPRSGDLNTIIEKFEKTYLPELEKDLVSTQAALHPVPAQPEVPRSPPSLQARIDRAIVNGAQKYTDVNVPALAIFSTVDQLPPNAPASAQERQAAVEVAANDFAAGLPSARVVKLPGASHAPWKTNEAEVVHEMTTFMGGLPRH